MDSFGRGWCCYVGNLPDLVVSRVFCFVDEHRTLRRVNRQWDYLALIYLQFNVTIEFPYGSKFPFCNVVNSCPLELVQKNLHTNYSLRIMQSTEKRNNILESKFSIAKDWIETGVLPPNLVRLDCGVFQPLELGLFPKSLTHLSFRNCDQQVQQFYNRLFEPGVLPPSLTHLLMGAGCKNKIQLEPGQIPNGLVCLKLPDDYNLKLEPGVLPATLTHLEFGSRYNQPLQDEVLPAGLTHLKFGWKFNRPLSNGVLPCRLSHLKFGFKFDQLLDRGVLPSSLTHISFGITYGWLLSANVFPHNMEHIEYNRPFSTYFETNLLNVVPIGCAIVSFGNLQLKIQERNCNIKTRAPTSDHWFGYLDPE